MTMTMTITIIIIVSISGFYLDSDWLLAPPRGL